MNDKYILNNKEIKKKIIKINKIRFENQNRYNFSMKLNPYLNEYYDDFELISFLFLNMSHNHNYECILFEITGWGFP